MRPERGKTPSYLDIARPPIQVHVQILHLAKLAEQLLQILFARLVVDVGHEDDPAFDAADRDGARRRFGVSTSTPTSTARAASDGLSGGGVVVVTVAVGGVAVDFHFG